MVNPTFVSAMMLTGRCVLQIGIAGRDDLTPVAQWLATACAEQGASLETIGRSELSRDPVGRSWRRSGSPADLVVVLQRWPEEFSSDDVTALIGESPLTRVVCVYGVWCDSAGRTRSQWPLSLRVPAWDAVTRLERELALLAGVGQPLPPTADRTETFAWQASAPTPGDAPAIDVAQRQPTMTSPPVACVHQPLVVHVVSPDPAYAAMLRDLCSGWGYQVVVQRPGESVGSDAGVGRQLSERHPERHQPGITQRVVLWDVDPLPAAGDEPAEILIRTNFERLQRNWGESPVIPLVGFPGSAGTTTLERLAPGRVVAKLAAPDRVRRALQAAVAACADRSMRARE